MGKTFAKAIIAVTFLGIGIGFGGYLFSASLPREFLISEKCQKHCLKPNEIAGLIASVGILRVPFLIPGIVMESDTCFAIRHTKPKARIHYVLFPKHDSKNITMLTSADIPYVLGCFALARELVIKDKLTAYRLHTNGPDFQEIAYLHFHLIAE